MRNHIGMLRRVMAVVATCLAAVGVAVWATPAAAVDPSRTHPDTLSRYCAEFRGAYTETRDSYSCDLDEDAITCFTDGRDCLFYSTERKPGQLPRKCEEAGGRFFNDVLIFRCDMIKDLPDFVLTVECTWDQLGNPKIPCIVYSEPPM
jgi:hypothetical protein